jgi:hypothetical protein
MLRKKRRLHVRFPTAVPVIGRGTIVTCPTTIQGKTQLSGAVGQRSCVLCLTCAVRGSIVGEHVESAIYKQKETEGIAEFKARASRRAGR